MILSSSLSLWYFFNFDYGFGADFLRNILFFQDDFTSEDFEHMTAPLLFNMFKTKTKYPLHSAIRLKREDVVFLYLIEFNQQVRNLIFIY